MKRAVATVIAVAAFAAPASAFAAPMVGAPLPSAKSTTGGTTTTTTPVRLTLNELADRRALNAYAAYLTTLVAQEPIGQTDDSSYVTTISGQCKAALTPLTQPPDQLNTKVQHTLTMLGQEMGDDLSVNYDLPATPAFTKFAGVLARLHWKPFSGALLVVKRYVNTETAVLALPASNLCNDASYAELKPEIIPDDTKTFIATYAKASNQANLALTNLTTLMQIYEIPSEKVLIARISTLANELTTQTKADLLQSGTSLTSVLESN